MNQRRHMTVISGVVTLLAAAPLSILFEQWTWIIDAVIVVTVVTGALVGVRALRAPVWSQPLAGLLALLLIVTWLNPSHHEYGGLLPSPGTFGHLGDLLGQAGSDVHSLAIPVPDTKGLLLIAMLGVGAVALVIDFVTVVLRKPALAGLPMLAIYAVPVAIDDHSVNILPFAISALGYAWLLVTDNIDRVRLFGRRFTGDGRGVDMWEPSPLGTVGRRIAVIGTLLAIIIPAAAPGMTKGFFGVGTGAGGDRICNICPAGPNVDLLANLAGQLHDSKQTPMLQVSTTDTRPPYVRLAVASTLTNHGFLTAPSTGTSYTSGLATPYYDPDTGKHAPGVTYETYTTTIKVTNLTVGYLPHYEVPTQIAGVSPKWRWDNVNDVLFSTSENTTSGMTYTITYARPVITTDALRAAPAIPADSPTRAFLTVPSSPREVTDVLNRPDTQASGEYDRVMKLYDYLSYRHGFSYSLETKGGSTGSDIGNFLTNKTGYCVQYAATLAWLVRAAGYPARVVEGFTSGAPAGKPGDYIMTNQNLHAWTEVYFEGLGWIPFDATPPVVGSVGQGYAPLNRITVDSSGGVDPSFSRSAGPAPSGVGKSGVGKPIPENNGSGGSARPATSSIGFWLTIVVILLAIGAIAPVVARTIARNRRSMVDGRVTSESAAPGEAYIVIDGGDSAARARQRVHSAWDEYIDTLVDYQVPVDPTETPRTATIRVVKELYLPTEVAGGVRTLGAAEERARYARHPGQSEPFTPVLRNLRRALSARVSWKTRLRAVLLPPSVTQRWRAAATANWITLAARSQRQRDGLGRTVNVRRWFARPSRAQ